MSRYNYTKLASLQNETSALSNINADRERVKTAIDNTLSRYGDSPNAMYADLDMNGNKILNLPEPSSLTEPVRLQDIQEFADSFGLVPDATALDVGKVLRVRSDALGYDFGDVIVDTTTDDLYPGTDDGSSLGTTTKRFSDVFLANGAVIDFNSGDVTITHGTDILYMRGAASGYRFSAVVAPESNDLAALGTTALSWSDLFLASGAVLNFSNGNSVITHSSGILTVSTGDLRVTTAGTNAASVVTVGGTQTLTNKTFTSPVINTPTLTVRDNVFTIQDEGDTTKQLQFQLSDITTATTRTLTVPNTSDTLVTLALAQTLTNKTLTAPVIATIVNTGTLTLPTSTDTLVGRATTDTLTNKTVNLTSNTLTGTTAQFNTALSDNDFATLAGSETLTNKTVNLTSNTLTGTTAQFNTALSDNDFATLAGSETLTNKTVNLTNNTLTGTTAQFNTALSDNDFATLAGTETLTNKTLTSPVINTPTLAVNDNAFSVRDDGDTSKVLQFQLSGITTATTRTLTVPNASDTIAVLATAQTLTNKTMALGSNTITGTTAQFNTALTDNDFATLAGTETLTNKTVNLANNTLTGNLAQFNTALSGDDFVSLTGSETLTNKSLTSPVVTGTMDIQQAIRQTGVISPTQITGNQNDYAPTGFATASQVRIDLSADWNVTGLAGGAEGRIVSFHNLSAFNLSFINGSASSTAANRFDINGDEVLAPKGTLTLRYDNTAQRWKKHSTTGSGAGGGGGAPSTAQYIVAATDATLSAERVATNGTSITWDFSVGGQATANLNLTGLTAETAPAVGDELALYDVSATTQDKITLENMFKVVNGFTTDSSPDFTADFVPTYDTSASGIKKVLLGNLGSSPRRTISSADTVVASDRNGLIDVTSGTFTLAFTAAATIGSGFSVIIHNGGTGDVTLDPNAAETIDGLASWILYPGGTIRVFCNGTAWFSVLMSAMTKVFNSSSTFTKPGAGSYSDISAWGAGGGGASGPAGDGGGGGGGGSCIIVTLPLSSFGATETITIGAGGASVSASNTDGNGGGNTTVGSLVTAYGGGGGASAGSGQTSGGGGGAGLQQAGTSVSGTTGGAGGNPQGGGAGADSAFGGGGGGSTLNAKAGSTIYGGGGGGAGSPSATAGGSGGDSVYGGAGGGGASDTGTGGAGGTAPIGGNGGAGGGNGGAPGPGIQPGGGGGGSENQASGAGGDGRVVITVY